MSQSCARRWRTSRRRSSGTGTAWADRLPRRRTSRGPGSRWPKRRMVGNSPSQFAGWPHPEVASAPPALPVGTPNTHSSNIHQYPMHHLSMRRPVPHGASSSRSSRNETLVRRWAKRRPRLSGRLLRFVSHVWTAPRMQEKNENSDGRFDCGHVSGLLARRMAAGPDGFAIQSQTMSGLRRAVARSGSLDRRFDRSSSHSALSPRHQRALQRIGRKPCRRSRVIVAHANWAIRLFNHGRSRAAVRSPEDQRDRTRLSPATPPPSRCPADYQARRPASGYILLDLHKSGNRIIPALVAAAAIGRAADANDRQAAACAAR